MNKDATTLYVVRHGTTDYNEQMRFQGAADIPLNDLGRKQGALLTDYFKDIPIDLGVTSPLKRARETLDYIIGKDREDQIPIIVEPGITEIDAGTFEGRPFREAEMLFPGFIYDFTHKQGEIEFPRGESGKGVYDRVSKSVMSIVRAHRGKTIAMASHGFAIQTWINFAMGIPADQMKNHVVDNVAVSKFTIDADDTIHVDYIGDSHHLKEEYKRNYDWNALEKPEPLLLHYSRCSTCKKARKFLDDNGIAYLERDMIEIPLSAMTLNQLMNRTDKPAKRFFNTSGKKYRELGLKDKVGNMTQQEMAEILSTDGMLVKRPLLVFTDKVLIGFREKEWREAFDLPEA